VLLYNIRAENAIAVRQNNANALIFYNLT